MEGSIMGQVRHRSATTTQAIRATIQRSQSTTVALSRELGINVIINSDDRLKPPSTSAKNGQFVGELSVRSMNTCFQRQIIGLRGHSRSTPQEIQ
jgi:hypothetical protein